MFGFLLLTAIFHDREGGKYADFVSFISAIPETVRSPVCNAYADFRDGSEISAIAASGSDASLISGICNRTGSPSHRREVPSLKRASFIGVEVTASLHARNLEVNVIGLGAVPMRRVLEEKSESSICGFTKPVGCQSASAPRLPTSMRNMSH